MKTLLLGLVAYSKSEENFPAQCDEKNAAAANSDSVKATRVPRSGESEKLSVFEAELVIIRRERQNTTRTAIICFKRFFLAKLTTSRTPAAAGIARRTCA